jgi:hypothetical protein
MIDALSSLQPAECALLLVDQQAALCLTGSPEARSDATDGRHTQGQQLMQQQRIRASPQEQPSRAA